MKYENTETGSSYEINADGLKATTPRESVFIRWDEARRLSPGKNDQIRLVAGLGRRKKVAVIGGLSRPQTVELVTTLVAIWGTYDRGAATKAAFDYAGNERATGWVLLATSLLFPGLLALLLLSDGIETALCSRLLPQGELATAQVMKVKKNKRGNFTWDVEFMTKDQRRVAGRRVTYVYDEKGQPKGDVTAVYSPGREWCWDLSMVPGRNAVNMRQRIFTTWLTLPLGIGFLVTMAVGLIVGLIKARRRLPYLEEIKEAGARLAASAGPQLKA